METKAQDSDFPQLHQRRIKRKKINKSTHKYSKKRVFLLQRLESIYLCCLLPKIIKFYFLPLGNRKSGGLVLWVDSFKNREIFFFLGGFFVFFGNKDEMLSVL